MRTILSAGVVLSAGALFGSTVVTGSVADYPQGGLYAHWDAALNAKADGQCVHNGTTGTWCDLKGRFDLSYSAEGAPTWENNAYVSDNSVVACMANSNPDFWTGLGATWTLQAYVVPTSKWWMSNSGICGYHTTRDAAVKGLVFGQHMTSDMQFYCWGNNALQSGLCVADSEVSSFTDKPLLLTLVATPTSLRLYVNDGLLHEMATKNVADTALNAPGFIVGSAFDDLGTGTTIFNGKIHSVRLYSRVLTSEEVRQSHRVDQMRFGYNKQSGVTRAYEYFDSAESTGAEQINTEIASLPGSVVEADFTVPVNALIAECLVFGHKWDANGYLLVFSGGLLRFHSGGVWVDIASAPDTWQPGGRLHFRGDSRGCELNGAWTTNLPPATVENDTATTIKLFSAGYHKGAFKLHHFSIKDEKGSFLCDYYPARRLSDNAAGLHDVAYWSRFKIASGGQLALGDVFDLFGLPASSDRTSARLAVLLDGASEFPLEMTAVLSHEGKTEQLACVVPSTAASSSVDVNISGLKPNTQYQVTFAVGSKASNRLCFQTQSEGFADGGYTPLDFVQSTGAEKCNLRLFPSDSLVTAIEFTPLYLSDAQGWRTCVFGTKYDALGYLLMFEGDKLLRFNSCGDWKDTDSSAWSINERVKAVCTTKGFDVNGLWTDLAGEQKDLEQDIWLLTTPERDHIEDWRAQLKIHGCVFSNRLGGVLRDYVPVRRNSDNAAGLYDRVNDEFCPSAVGGAFAAGSEVELPWLTATVTNFTGRSLSATLTRSAGGATDIYVAWGTDYAGANAAGWESVRKVGSFAADAVSVSVSVGAISRSARYLRFYTADGRWSATQLLTDLPRKPRGLVLSVY